MVFCSISGTVPEQPVVSTKSGHVFERRLIEKYVRETGKCPITNEALALDDLLPIKANKTVKPRTAPASSIPGLLGMFHDEWDALMLETHSLRQQLHTVRQELCHALYQQDAATRVIARLIRERDEARDAAENARSLVLAEQAKRSAAASEGQAAAKRQKAPSIPEQVLQELQEVNTQLSKGRKKRAVPPTLATPEDLGRMELLSSNPLHKTTQGGITHIEINPENPAVVATAGADGTVQIFDYVAQRQLGAAEGHSKRVTGLQYVSSSVLVTSSQDRTARIWAEQEQQPGSFACTAVLKDHQAEVVGVTLHPSRKYFVTASVDATWCFYDLQTASCLRQVSAEGDKEAYTTVQFHPDGLILGTATETNSIRIWEVKAQKNVASFSDHTRPVRSLAFSENGYYLASAAEDCVKIWDLRKLKVLKNINPFEDAACNAVAWDYSGTYLAIGGPEARVYQHQKQEFAEVRAFADLPKKGAMALQWGADARTLFVGAADHNLRIFGLPAEAAAKSSQG